MPPLLLCWRRKRGRERELKSSMTSFCIFTTTGKIQTLYTHFGIKTKDFFPSTSISFGFFFFLNSVFSLITRILHVNRNQHKIKEKQSLAFATIIDICKLLCVCVCLRVLLLPSTKIIIKTKKKNSINILHHRFLLIIYWMPLLLLFATNRAYTSFSHAIFIKVCNLLHFISFHFFLSSSEKYKVCGFSLFFPSTFFSSSPF